FQGIKRMPAGSYLIYQNNKTTIKKYWDLANTSYDFLKLTSVKIREKFEQLIADSIKLRFRSDVPVGINLSSGLDSNSMLYYTNNIIGTNVTMFTMCTISDEYNECALLEKSLNNQQKQYWHTCFVDHNEIFLQAEKMNFIQDQPFGGIPTIAYSELIKTAQQHNTTVLLEGQGLDELLAGYKYYLVEHLKDLKQANNKQQHLHYSQDMSKLIYIDILDKDFINAKQSRQLFFKSSFKSNLLNAQYRDIVYTKIPRVLRFNDHVTMHYGRELRLPYLDHRIVEFCFHLPAEYKINQDLQKVLMRELMEDKLPNIMRNNPKKTFGAVQTEWLRKYYKEQAMALLNSESFKQRGYWNLKLLKNKVDNFYKGEGNNSFFIWQCFNLEMWFKSYID
ncbi:hypothetical protein KAU19_05520, partial [Candidatus Parcubacteria bacterium]|nr:hypothetical protein [Candidatus Parcubacteria bacterium]